MYSQPELSQTRTETKPERERKQRSVGGHRLKAIHTGVCQVSLPMAVHLPGWGRDRRPTDLIALSIRGHSALCSLYLPLNMVLELALF